MNFNKTRRQKFLSEKDYLESRRLYEIDFNDTKSILFTGYHKDTPIIPEAASSFRWDFAYDHMELLLLDYTAGRPIEEVQAQLKEVIDAFDVYMANEVLPSERTPPTNEADTFNIEQLDAYVCVFWLLALCKLLRHDEFISTVMKWVNRSYRFSRGVDSLFENVVQKLTYNPARVPQEVLHPEPYQPLADAIIATAEERPALVKEFVESWYKGMKPCGWYGAHIDGFYFGYWCLEAALVTALWDIDDSSYRDHLVYPKDLVDWYRAQKNLAPDGTPLKRRRELKALPGEICPRSGNWFRRGMRKYMKVKAGELMPGPELDVYGQVIWYLEVEE
jgi:hypothetical protein